MLNEHVNLVYSPPTVFAENKVAQTFSTNAAVLGNNITWNNIGGVAEVNSHATTFGVGSSGITILEDGIYIATIAATFELSGTRAQGNVELLLNGSHYGPATLFGSSTYHRQSGGSGVDLVSVLPEIAMNLSANDVVSGAVQRVQGSTISSNLTLRLARLTIRKF